MLKTETVLYDDLSKGKVDLSRWKLLSFPVGESLQRAEVGHFRKAPKTCARGHVHQTHHAQCLARKLTVNVRRQREKLMRGAGESH